MIKQNEINYSKILNELTKEELTNFIKQEILPNPHLSEIFRKYFTNYLPQLSLEEYEMRLKSRIYDCSDDSGFISYKNTYQYEISMHEFISETDILIKNKKYKLSFEILKMVLDSLPDLPIDDSNGSTSSVADSCIERILIILKEIKGTKQEEIISRNVFKYLENEILNDILSNYGIELDELKDYFIENRLFTNEMINTLNRKIDNINSLVSWREYKKKYYIMDLIRIYELNNMNDEKENIIKNNLDNKEIFEIYIDSISNLLNEYELIDKLLELKHIYPKNSSYISYKLLELYEKTNKQDSYKEELYNLFFDSDKYNFKLYLLIKKMYSDKEWILERNNIIEKIKLEKVNERILLEIYKEEKMIDELYQLLKDYYICEIKRYEELLLDKYSKELINIYINECKRNLEYASNRNKYREIARDLKHIKNIDKDNYKYEEFLAFIKQEYGNKSALQDEISMI